MCCFIVVVFSAFFAVVCLPFVYIINLLPKRKLSLLVINYPCHDTHGSYVPVLVCFRKFCLHSPKNPAGPVFTGTVFFIISEKIQTKCDCYCNLKKDFHFSRFWKCLYKCGLDDPSDPLERPKINLKYIDLEIKVQPMAMPKGCVKYTTTTLTLTHKPPWNLGKKALMLALSQCKKRSKYENAFGKGLLNFKTLHWKGRQEKKRWGRMRLNNSKGSQPKLSCITLSQSQGIQCCAVIYQTLPF